jgi:nitrate/nitrite transporter NarK
MTLFSYTRPVAALLAGFIADKITPRVCTKYLFFFMVGSYAFLSIFNLDKQIISIVYLNLTISMVGVFALRGIFYSLLEDSYIPSSITGAAVGIISFIGYLPDVFIGPLFGFLLDLEDIKSSFQIFFIFLLLISTFGLVTSIYLKKN